MHWFTLALAACILSGWGFTADSRHSDNRDSPPERETVSIWLIGDSTVADYSLEEGFTEKKFPITGGEQSRQFYQDRHMGGTVGLISGWATAVFENCTLFCKRGGYVTAPSANQGADHGFVFLNCRVTGEVAAGSIYPGRPWRPYGKSVFIGCYPDNQIIPAGWNNGGKPESDINRLFC